MRALYSYEIAIIRACFEGGGGGGGGGGGEGLNVRTRETIFLERRMYSTSTKDIPTT